MIRNRLSILLAERSIKITRVAKDTGISRSTLNNISKNDTDMIRLDTINTLCKYLNVTPCEFFDYEPLDIDFSIDVVSMPFKIENNNDRRVLRCESLEADLFMDIDWGRKKESVDLSCELMSDIIFKDNLSASESVEEIEIHLKVEFEDEEKKEQFINEVYSEIDATFYSNIYGSLISVIVEGMFKKIKSNINHYIENHLDPESNFTGISDSIFEQQLKYVTENNLDFNIVSDVFKPF